MLSAILLFILILKLVVIVLQHGVKVAPTNEGDGVGVVVGVLVNVGVIVDVGVCVGVFEGVCVGVVVGV